MAGTVWMNLYVVSPWTSSSDTNFAGSAVFEFGSQNA